MTENLESHEPPIRRGPWLFVSDRRDIYLDKNDGWVRFQDESAPRYARSAVLIDKIAYISERASSPRVILCMSGVITEDGLIPVDHTLEEILAVLNPLKRPALPPETFLACSRCGRGIGGDRCEVCHP